MVLSWLKTNFEAAKQGLTTELGKYKNKEMLEAIVAGCAMVSCADGNISSAEKQKMMGFLRNSETLRVFDSSEVIKIFQKYADKFEFDTTIATGEAMAAIGKFKGKSSEAQLIVRVCMAVSASDGNFDAQEQEVVRRMCRELELDPKQFE